MIIILARMKHFTLRKKAKFKETKMKLISFHYNGRERFGAVKEGGIVDLSSEKFQEASLKNLKAVLELSLIHI